MLSIAVAGKKTAHADEDFVNSVFETLAGIFRCTKEQLIRDYCFHSTTRTCCRNSDGTLSNKEVTKVGLRDAVRAWFGKWGMSFRRCTVHANPFTLHRVGEDPRVGQTCLAFGMHRLCEHARNALYRQKQGGKLGHSNHSLVTPFVCETRGRQFNPGVEYTTLCNAADEKMIRKDPDTRSDYFPDIKLKNTWLGKHKNHPGMSSFMPILDYAELCPFSRHRAEELGLGLDTDKPAVTSEVRAHYAASIHRQGAWQCDDRAPWDLGQTKLPEGGKRKRW